MMKTTLAAAIVNLSLAIASPLPRDEPQQRPYHCTSFTLPVSVENVPVARFPFDITDQYEATNLLNTITNRVQSQDVPPVVTVNRTYDILAYYCSPKSQSSSTLQILSHGIGFNHSYWDFYPSGNSSDDQYSYIAAATGAGHSVLTYNRLGIAGSPVPDPFSEVQSTLEVAILVAITAKARAGQVPGQKGAPSKVIHVGHSFGSIITNSLVSLRPELSDGIILTGYSHRLDWNLYFAINSNFLLAHVADPVKFPASQYPAGYATWPSKWANQYSFFAYPNFDKAVLDDAEDTKQPYAFGELLTFSLLGDLTAPAFTKPVLYVNGEKDLIFCASNCTGLIEPGTPAYNAFNASNDIESVIVPGFGHGINLHLGAKDKAYSAIKDWASRKGF